MKFKLIIFIFLISIVSCKEKSGSANTAKNIDTENLSMGDMPNKQTKYDTIYTVNSPDNTGLINELKAKLEKANFTFEERKNRGGFSYNNCEENRQTITVGNGSANILHAVQSLKMAQKIFILIFKSWFMNFRMRKLQNSTLKKLKKH